jgi:hypothetical protein
MGSYGPATKYSAIALLGICFLATAQNPPADNTPLLESGHIQRDGHSTPYRIRRLPVSSFPDLPANIAAQLEQRGCMIPQTYQAHRPENVVHASLEHAGSSDWAVLCSVQGTVSLLVFFGSASSDPTTLASGLETQHLQGHGQNGLLGFNWAIDPATPEAVHQAQINMAHHPPRLDHDALADSVIDHSTVYRIYKEHAWTVTQTAD